MRRTLGLALLCITALAPIRVEAEAPTVVVRQGDVLGAIARRAGISVVQLKQWNGLDDDFIRVGQRLRVGPEVVADTEDDGIDWTPPFDYAAEREKVAKPKPAPIAARDPSTAVASGAAEPPGKKRSRKRVYRVRKGDTLAGIALRHNTTIDDLLRANPELHPNRIYPGQPIDVGEPTPAIVFRLERGDTLAAAAGRYGVTARDVVRWNARLGGSHPRPGTPIRIYTRKAVSPSEAIGPTNRGRLEGGIRLPPHRGYLIRAPARTYGTEETIRWIVDAFDAVDRKFRDPKVVRIHDISDRDGGRLRDHKSHQNGRDVDISYYQDDCGRAGCAFAKFKSSDLDVARQWALLEHWLRNGQAEMIFIDYRLQAKLYKYARRKGVSKAQLSRWIQYPRGRYEPQGVIRHFPNHADHLHVRFVCPYSDLKCRP